MASLLKNKGGDLPDPFEDEEEPELRRMRRYYRKKPISRRPKRWRKHSQS